MECVETWIKIFSRAWEEDNDQGLSKILKDSPDYFRNIPSDKKETALEIIFNKHNGLFEFIISTMKMQSQEQQFSYPLEEAFNTLQILMEIFQDEYEPYLKKSKNVCLMCINTFSISGATKRKAAKTLKKMMALFKNYDLGLSGFVKKANDSPDHLILFSAVAKYQPETQYMFERVNGFFLEVLENLELYELAKVEEDKEIIKIYLECLEDMMTNFESNSNLTTFYIEKFYNVLSLFESAESEEVKSTAIRIFLNNIQHFATFLVRDYEKWQKMLTDLYRSNPSLNNINALKSFYKIISLHLVVDDNEEAFLFFKNSFLKALTCETLPSNELNLAIHGLSEFCVIYSKYSPGEFDKLFQMIVHHNLSLFKIRTEESVKSYQDILPDVIKILSEILDFVEKISNYHINALIELNNFVIQKYSELDEYVKTSLAHSLRISIAKVRLVENTFREQYFRSLFYDGIMWSCNQTLLVDVQLQKELNINFKSSVTYKNYLPFWRLLIEADDQSDLIHFIFQQIILVLMCLIDKTNFNVGQCSSGVSYLLKAQNDKDMKLFLNLIDLYQELIESTEFLYLEKQLEKCLTYLISNSYKHPLTSGFYKLITAVILKPGDSYDYSNKISSDSYEFIKKYFWEVVQFATKVSDDLQISCITLVFNVPLCFIEEIIDETVSVFKAAFEIGLRDSSLARHALETLKAWTRQSNNKDLENYYENMISDLEPYLWNNSNINSYQALSTKLKTDVITTNSQTMKYFQRNILSMYGSQNSSTVKNSIFQRSLTRSLSWNDKTLPFQLIFTNTTLEIHLDKLILDIKIENCRGKFAACEFLYTVITIILGQKLTHRYFNKDLLTIIIKLGCDSNEAIRRLFHPLVVELTHYFSSPQMTESSVTQDFVNVLFENLVNEFDFYLRHYCLICLKEFVSWEIKQCFQGDIVKSPTLIKIIKKIINCALYPTKNEILAAATTFNVLYKFFFSQATSNMSIINLYWLQLLNAFVTCLEEYNDVQIMVTLNNIKHTIRGKPNVLNARFFPRQRSPGFSSETLTGAVMWLLEKSCSTNSPCRQKCMDLFESLCEHTQGFKSVNEFIINFGLENVDRIALKDLEGNSGSITLVNIKAFLRSLDFYDWIIIKRFVTPEMILAIGDTTRNNYFLRFLKLFVHTIINRNVNDIANESTSTMREAEELIQLLNAAIPKILRFVNTILFVKENDATSILELFWNDDFYLLICRFSLSPQKIGLTHTSTLENFPELMENFLKGMTKNMPEPYLSNLQSNFFVESQQDIENFVDVPNIINLENNIFKLRNFLRGMISLKKCQFIDFVEKCNFTTEYAKEKVINMLVALKSVNSTTQQSIQIHFKIYLEDLMYFFLYTYQPEIIEAIVNLIIEDSANFAPSKNPLEQFHLETFNFPIFECMLKRPDKSLKIINDTTRDHPRVMFPMIEQFMLHGQKSASENVAALADEVLNSCSDYRTLTGDDARLKARLFNINRMAVMVLRSKSNNGDLMEEATEQTFHAWIMEEYKNCRDPVHKLEIIEICYLCVADNVSKESTYLSSLFENLRVDDLEKLRNDSAARIRAIDCFKVLLQMLIFTRSKTVYEGILAYAAGSCEFFSKNLINQSLHRFFMDPLAQDGISVLTIAYEFFKNTEKSVEQRLDALNYFLLPSLENCKTNVTDEFFERYIQDIVESSQQSFDGSDVSKRMQSLTTKIGCFKLFELMFNMLEFEKIMSFDHDASKNNIYMEWLFHMTKTRGFVAKFDEEKELARKMHCAAMNTCIAIVCWKSTRDLYNVVFKEKRNQRELVWERIIDCDRIYKLDDTMPKRCDTRFVNLRKTNEMTTYVHNNNNHAKHPRYGSSWNKQYVKLEKDELNDHECMPMIVGLILHVFNCNVMRLPKSGDDAVRQEDLPNWLVYLKEAFDTKQCNVALFLLKVVANVKKAFQPFLPVMYEPMARAVCFYLSANDVNYVIRDVLFVILEARYKITSESEVKVSQILIEVLISKARSSNDEIYEYNMQLIEELLILWRDSPLKIPQSSTINRELSYRATLVYFRHNVDVDSLITSRQMHESVRDGIFRWQEPLSELAFENLGWIVQNISEEQRRKLIDEDLIDLFGDMADISKELCVSHFYRVFSGYPDIAKYKELYRYFDMKSVETEDRKVECLEMFLYAMDELSPSDINWTCSRLRVLMRDRYLSCLNVGFEIVQRLIAILEANQMLPYAEVVEIYTRDDVLLEHRTMAYDFFIALHRRYSDTVNTMNEYLESSTLINVCKRSLIRGVVDPSEEIREKLQNFWSSQPDGTMDRFVHVIQLYSIDASSHYSQFACLRMLDLASKSPQASKALFAPLVNCKFEEYNVVEEGQARRKTRILSPMFSPSFSSRLDRAMAVQCEAAKTGQDAATIPRKPITAVKLLEKLTNTKTVVPTSKIPDPFENELSKRFAKTAEVKAEKLANRQRSVDEYYKKLEKEKLARRENIKVSRKYRIGNFPDVEITNSDVISTFANYVRQDEKFASELFIAIVDSLEKSLKDTETHAEFVQDLTEFCGRAVQEPNTFVPTALEIMLRCGCKFDAVKVAKVSKAMGLQSLGILLLESASSNNELFVKCRKKSYTPTLQHGAQLAYLYQSLGERDVVSSICQNWNLTGVSIQLKKAYVAEVKSDFFLAQDFYNEACQQEDGDNKDLCFEGMLRCLNELANWDAIDARVIKILNSVKPIWLHPKINLLRPWLITTRLQKHLQDIAEGGSGVRDVDRFIGNLAKHMVEKGEDFVRRFGEEISVFYLADNNKLSITVARRCLKSRYEYLMDRWISEPTVETFDDICSLNDVSSYLVTIESEDVCRAARGLLNYWRRNSPKSDDELPSWHRRVGYRVGLACFLVEKLKDDSMDSGILFNVMVESLKQRLQLSELALDRNCKEASYKINIQVEKAFEHVINLDERFIELFQDLKLLLSRYKYTCALTELESPANNTGSNVFFNFSNSWQSALELMDDRNVATNTRMQAKYRVLDIVAKLDKVFKSDPESVQSAMESPFITGTLQTRNAEEAEDALFNHYGRVLSSCCDEGGSEDMAKSCMKFAEYCQSLIFDKIQSDVEMQKALISSLLRAMNCGSRKAARYFPSLLNQSLYKSEQNRQVFDEGCLSVPSWMFLRWQDVIVSHLATPLSPRVLPIIERLVQDYPNVMQYSFWTVCESHPELRDEPAVNELYAPLFANSKTVEFFKSMKYLRQPELYLKCRVTELAQSVGSGEAFAAAIDDLIRRELKNTEDSYHQSHLQYSLYDVVLGKYREDLEKLKASSDHGNAVKQICEVLESDMQKRLKTDKVRNSSDLHSYSSFLNDFKGEDLEMYVPVRYVEYQKPMLKYHPKIARFDSFVQIVPSDSWPIKVTMIGSNAKRYDFLVKHQVDLRRDQRMQGFFEMTGQILNDNRACGERRLSVKTYNIVPLSKSAGLVQWFDDVRSLREFVELCMPDKTVIEATAKSYSNWIYESASEKNSKESQVYKQAISKYSRKRVIDKMKEFSEAVQYDNLRKAFVRISSSPDCFYKLRQNFVKSYSTMCAVHWIAGVGDRSLGNTLVDVKTGNCLGINFTLNFGTGVDLPVPELVPFRLTPQLLGLLQPFTEKDTLGATMTHVLNALNEEKHFILPCLGVFMNEPLNWNEKVKERWRENGDEQKSKEIKWLPKKKLLIIQKKLDGCNPSDVLIKELSFLHDDDNEDDTQYFPFYESIVGDIDGSNSIGLTQVQCLLNQATDMNVLGRMRASWHPFV